MWQWIKRRLGAGPETPAEARAWRWRQARTDATLEDVQAFRALAHTLNHQSVAFLRQQAERDKALARVEMRVMQRDGER